MYPIFAAYILVCGQAQGEGIACQGSSHDVDIHSNGTTATIVARVNIFAVSSRVPLNSVWFGVSLTLENGLRSVKLTKTV